MRPPPIDPIARVLAMAVVAAGVVFAAVRPVPAAAVPPEATATTIDLEAASAVDPATGDRIAALSGGTLYHVVFFATWCPPCLEEMPQLADLHERFEEDGYVLVLVAISHRQDRERVFDFAFRSRAPGRVLFDDKDVLRTLLDVERIPTHVLIDGHGRVVLRTAGFDTRITEVVGETVRRGR